MTQVECQLQVVLEIFTPPPSRSPHSLVFCLRVDVTVLVVRAQPHAFPGFGQLTPHVAQAEFQNHRIRGPSFTLDSLITVAFSPKMPLCS